MPSGKDVTGGGSSGGGGKRNGGTGGGGGGSMSSGTTSGGPKKNAYCSFCRKSYRDVGPLVEGPGDVYICGDCIELCQSDPRPGAYGGAASPRRSSPISPPRREIKDQLDAYVIGQERAKKVLWRSPSTTITRGWSTARKPETEVELDKSNILLIGPTGCGKTLLARTMARVLERPVRHR